MTPDKPVELPDSNSTHDEDEGIFENPAEGFERGWLDMLEGNPIPASDLLDELNDEI